MKIIVSRPAWARGLKLWTRLPISQESQSRPAWARGLKRSTWVTFDFAVWSRPAWARGLKRHLLSRLVCGVLSRPAWARGLKHEWSMQISGVRGVAPRVGAWIETCDNQHPIFDSCRAPRGRVD